MSTFQGLGVSPGTGIAPILRMSDPVREPESAPALSGELRVREWQRAEEACHRVGRNLLDRAARATGEARAVLEATAGMAVDSTLLARIRAAVLENGQPGPQAVWSAADGIATMFLGSDMGARVRDVQDVRDRIVSELLGLPMPGVPVHDTPFVLVARDLAPADTATLDTSRVVGLVTQEGGPTSHSAILARALGVPAIVACDGVSNILEGTVVFLDGTTGEVICNPGSELQDRHASAAAAGTPSFSGGCTTADGHRVEILANVGGVDGAVEARDAGADGIGLFRTEFCFLDREEAPSVAEQIAAYLPVFRAFEGRKVVIRTLDAGADKPLPFVSSSTEPNPALGVRGYRTSWRDPGVLEDQLEAIAEAASKTSADVWVMAPMIATAAEASAFARLANRAGIAKAGVMIEVPAAALAARAILEHVSFASVGTNDLVQYTMAADRQLSSVSTLNDPWQPAVLRLVEIASSHARDGRKPLGVCGEAAADPLLACVLLGLGVTSLSMTWRAMGAVSGQISRATLAQCRAAAGAALAAASPEQARVAARSEIQPAASASGPSPVGGGVGDRDAVHSARGGKESGVLPQAEKAAPKKAAAKPAVKKAVAEKKPAAPKKAAVNGDDALQTRSVLVGSSNGLHARSASIISQTAAGLKVRVRIASARGGPVDASSMLALMSLGASYQDEVFLTAPEGPGCGEALETLAELIGRDLDHD